MMRMVSVVLVLAAAGCGLEDGGRFVPKKAKEVRKQEKTRKGREAEMTLAAFLAQRPAAPKTVAAECSLDNYYNFAYGDSAATHHSVRLYDRRTTTFAHAWAAKDSAAGKRLFALLSDGEEHPLVVKVALQGPDGKPNPPDRQELAILAVVE